MQTLQPALGARGYLLVLIAVCGVAVCGVAGCGGGVDPETSLDFQEANRAFAAADSTAGFLSVANRYQAILDRGVLSGAVLYNQGNAWMRAGETGRAIASYRQAYRYRPRDSHLAANLRSALASTSVPPPATPLVGYLFFWQDWLSYPEKFTLSTVLLMVTLVAATLVQFEGCRIAGRRCGALSGLLLILALFSTGWDWYRFERTEHGVVITDEVTARKGNSENYEPAFTELLREGAEFQVLERRGDWLHIRLGGSGDAWLEDRDTVTY